jgi:hypothetical protein
MAETMTRKRAITMLKAIGFDNAGRNFTVAVKGFQRGYNLGKRLRVDGDFGPLTSAALAKSFARHRQGKPTMSAHFSYAEFRCKCGGRFKDCRRIWVMRPHVRRLEAYRTFIGKPVRIVSGCRCKGRNKEVGGSTQSQHMFGAACDIDGRLTVAERRELRLFAGLGKKGSTRKVIHVDSRDRGTHHTTSGTPASPTVWTYAT